MDDQTQDDHTQDDHTQDDHTKNGGQTFDRAAAQAFFRLPHVGVFAVEAEDGPPAAVPVWYACSDDATQVWVHTPPGSRKARLLGRTRRATLVVQTVAPRTRFVSVELEMVDHHTASPDDVRELASRYLTGEELEGYVQFAGAQLQEHRYAFRPTRWRFADLTM